MHPPESDQLSLAPGAGQGIVKKVFDELLSDANFVKEMVAAAHDGLNAMTARRWDREANNGKGGWICDPDYKTRVHTLFGLFAQAEGEPVKRVMHEIHRTGQLDPLAALRDSPALQDAAERLIAKSKFRDRNGKKAKKAEAIEADAVEV